MGGKEREITLHIINFDLQFDQWKRKKLLHGRQHHSYWLL